ncbi:MAG: ATP-dependent DNA ligase [Candidatus Micrarchaeota archaeon]|nr:ATP-dependent DNA ligase [Candidatus Micrarchaeota archaeon]
MLFKELAEYYDRLESVSSRLKMIEILSELMGKLDADEASAAVYITQGILLPAFEGAEMGVADRLVEEAAAIATGYRKEQIESEYRKTGDMGLAVQNIKEKTKLKGIRSRQYRIKEIYEGMMRIADTSGAGSKEKKVNMLADMIGAGTPAEAKYIARFPLGQLRLGVGDSTIMEALSVANTGDRKFKAEVERAYNICSDLGLVARELKAKGKRAIEDFRVSLFKPVRPALAERLATAEDILERMHGIAAVEQKYDGFRVQVHKDGRKIRLFSRRLENTTEMFPDIVKAVEKEVGAGRIIFEGEALAFNEATSEYLPFQETIQRKRKHDIAKKAEELPLHLFAFDLLYLDEKDWLSEPYEKRRSKIEEILKNGKLITPTTRIVTKSPKELDEFFAKSIENGLEGVIAKDLDAPYIAGARKFSWIKLKRSYRAKLADSMDLVILGYYLGHGSRAEFKFGGLLCGVYNEKRDMFETISRIGTGFTEVQMEELRDKLNRIKTKGKPARVDSVIAPDFWVDPRYVVTVNADEITKSPMHTCGRSKNGEGIEIGYALRFPRLVGGEHPIRSDKGPEETTTTGEIIEMFKLQKKVGLKE